MEEAKHSYLCDSFGFDETKTMSAPESLRVKDIPISTNVPSETDVMNGTRCVVEQNIPYSDIYSDDSIEEMTLNTDGENIDYSTPSPTNASHQCNVDNKSFRRQLSEGGVTKRAQYSNETPTDIMSKHLSKSHSRSSLPEINDVTLSRHAFLSLTHRKMSDLDLAKLKETTARLHLETRRPSFVAWRSAHLPKWTSQDIDYIEETRLDSPTGDGRIDKVLESIRQDLTEMRQTDQMLARKLLLLRKDIYKVKMMRTCSEHEEILREVQENMAEIHELSDLCDIPFDTLHPLQHIGVTRLNFYERRFSTS